MSRETKKDCVGVEDAHQGTVRELALLAEPSFNSKN